MNTIYVDNLPVYLDGGDGNLWQSRDVWAEILSKPGSDIAVRRYVRISDVIALLVQHGVKLALVADGPTSQENSGSSHGILIESGIDYATT